ncbi:MAG: carboxypeptidase-like regulatory domain-containing protein, partial [Candidatus Acidiferrales bacterium]
RRLGARWLTFLASVVFGCACPALAQQRPTAASRAPSDTSIGPQSSAPHLLDQQATGSIVGNIVDQSGTPVFGAHIKLMRKDQLPPPSADSDQDGQFSFANVPPGPFQVSISATGFNPQTISGVLNPGEFHTLPKIALFLAPVVTQVVVEPQSVIAQQQIKQEEKQRVLGVFPNFYVTYLPNPAPLDVHQKFQMAWKSNFDPVTFLVAGAAAGLQQADGQFGGFGTGAEGYAKRYGATYADISIGTFLGDAVFPSLFKQDPRFFYKGSGTVRSRILYALAAAFMAKGDNGRWQPDYSNFLGDLASGGISNLYYAPQDRNGAALTFENVAISAGGRAAANLLEEFVVPKITLKPHLPFHHDHPTHT